MSETLATSRLTIDLSALQENWTRLAGLAGPTRTGAVVKADSYSLGAAECARALWDAGARTFFVVFPAEGIALRAILPQARILLLSGLDASSAPHCREAGITPVLNCTEELEAWRAEAKRAGAPLACALHFDTGMNRLGFDPREAARLAGDRDGLEVVLVMSHLACGDERANLMNARQLGDFRKVASHFPGVRLSLANSAGTLLGPDYHFDLVRPGIALYGGGPMTGEANPMLPVVCFEAKILQVRSARKGETVGYSATQALARDSRIAVAGAGYSDGIRRGASGRPDGGAKGWFAGYTVPVLGRVSMDLTAFDVTDIPAHLLGRGEWIEFFGPNMPLDNFARACGTISYEVLTGLGNRAEKVYLPAQGKGG
jgi:alanine racemase